MITLTGKYNSANVYTDVIDDKAIAQIIELLNQPLAENQRIAIMPDVHAGASCVIGTTMTVTDKIIPNLVGVDIGCGMETVKLAEKELDFNELDAIIRRLIPSGFEIRNEPHSYAGNINLDSIACKTAINKSRAENSIGTLGGGNHFIEIDKDTEGNLYLIVHSGSRHLGIEVATYYQNEAYRQLAKPDKSEINKIIERLKSENRHEDISSELKAYYASMTCVPKQMAYCEGVLFDDYIHDMKIVQTFASLNRKAMVNTIVNAMNLHVTDQFTTIHNYIDTDNMIMRKGSVSAQKDEKLLIPINMRDGSLICIGKGNPEYNYSAPHGAGRLFSRSQAKTLFSVEEYAAEMNGIFTTSVSSSTLDECPMAYKSIDDIINNLHDTVTIVSQIKPVYNFKAGDA